MASTGKYNQNYLNQCDHIKWNSVNIVILYAQQYFLHRTFLTHKLKIPP